MNSYVAFLRGINVGGRVIKMADLKACLESLGLTNIKTYLQSGNVSFESNETNLAKLRSEIESGVTERFGYQAIILIYSAEALKDIIAAYPFATEEDIHDYVILLSDDIFDVFGELASSTELSVEKVQAGKHCFYWKVPKGMTLESAFAKAMAKAKFPPHYTVRNIKTLKKMV